MSLFRLLPLFAASLLVLAPSGAEAQALPAVLDALRQGGGWVQIPIQGGQGRLTTPSLPAGGMKLTGCMEIWPGHSGRFTLKVADTFGNGRLEADAGPAEDIPFTYAPGPFAQLQVDVRWSEPRDTTLMVWIGVQRQGAQPRTPPRDTCEPVYADGG